MFGSFEIQMKVAAGDTAGTVTAFYVCAHGESHRSQIEMISFCCHCRFFLSILEKGRKEGRKE
jgi:hypothetical protein